MEFFISSICTIVSKVALSWVKFKVWAWSTSVAIMTPICTFNSVGNLTRVLQLLLSRRIIIVLVCFCWRFYLSSSSRRFICILSPYMMTTLKIGSLKWRLIRVMSRNIVLGQSLIFAMNPIALNWRIVFRRSYRHLFVLLVKTCSVISWLWLIHIRIPSLNRWSWKYFMIIVSAWTSTCISFELHFVLFELRDETVVWMDLD